MSNKWRAVTPLTRTLPGAYQLIMQDDGNLCLYQLVPGASSTCYWASNTYGKGTGPWTMAINSDCYLTVTDSTGTVRH